MGTKLVEIIVDPNTRPSVLPIVVFPGEYVEFSSRSGQSTFFFADGDKIFEAADTNLVAFTVRDGDTVALRIKPGIFYSGNLELPRSFGPSGALFVEYAVQCRKVGETYFAQGNSAPRIIIPPPIGA